MAKKVYLILIIGIGYRDSKIIFNSTDHGIMIELLMNRGTHQDRPSSPQRFYVVRHASYVMSLINYIRSRILKIINEYYRLSNTEIEFIVKYKYD